MAMLDTNNAPYWDDFNEDKNFLRILFNPARAVQARELTQAQTILQNQVAQFADRIFINNTRVLKAETTVNFDKETIVAPLDNNGATTLFDDLLNKRIMLISGGVLQPSTIAEVSNVSSTDNALLLTYEGGSFNIGDEFAEVDVNGTQVGNLTHIITSTHNSITASVAAGIIYSDGFFIKTEEQEIVIDSSPNAQTTKYKIGLTAIDAAITENDDGTLVDNAAGTFNEGAPGAHRLNRTYKLESHLFGTDLGSSSKFVTHVIIDQGAIITDLMKNVKYSDIMDIMARRTTDESGNYVSDEFIMLPVEQNPVSLTRFNLEVSPGKAYVQGYEVENEGTLLLPLDKSQDFDNAVGKSTFVEYGPYFDILNVNGSPQISGAFDINGNESVEFYTTKANAIAGTNPVALPGISPKISSIIKNANGEVRIAMVDTYGLSSQFNSVRFIKGVTSLSIAEIELYSGSPVLGNTHKTELLFDLLETDIKSVSDVAFEYYVSHDFSGTTDAAGIVEFSAPTGGVFMADIPVAYVKDAAGIEGVGTDIVIMSNNDSNLLRLTITGVVSQAVVVTAQVKYTAAKKVKTSNIIIDESHTLASATTLITLLNSDVYMIDGVSVNGNALSDTEYTFTTGQTDTSYDAGSIILNTQGALNDVVLVSYKYYSHGSGDYFTVDSYPNTWETIGTYLTESGTLYRLTDSLDFRKKSGDVGKYPTLQESVRFQYENYLSRIDKVFVDKYGEFGITKGLPSKTPFAPADKVGSMTVATIHLEPFTGLPENIALDLIANKAYTMTEIKELENRIENLEYYSSLNLLEQEAKDLLVTDGYGNNRFKNGIFVDNFESHDLGNIDDLNYDISMDTDEGFIRPPFTQQSLQFATALYGDSVAAAAANVSITDDEIVGSISNIATMSYTTEPFIEQLQATDFINVNPYAIFAWNNGKVVISPASDFWFDDVSLPTIRRTLNSSSKLNSRSALWRNWSTVWAGYSNRQKAANTAISSTTGISNFGRTRITRITTTSIKTAINDKVVSSQWIQLMRARTIRFHVSNLRPNSTVLAFFDGVDVTNLISASDVSYLNGGVLKTDSSGNLFTSTNIGIFSLPASVFKTGTKTFEIKDTVDEPITSGETDYTSKGIIRYNQKTITSIREARISVTTSRIPSRGRRRSRWGDPIAQSFLIEQDGGVFLNSIDVFFKQKDDNLPVSVEIVEMNNGIPTQNTIPMSYTIVKSADVYVPIINGDINPTTFRFEAPIYLQDGTSYALVVKTNSTKYELFYAKLGKPSYSTFGNLNGQAIIKQPYTGVMFKSQNAETWTEDQNSDVMFRLNRCKFDTVSTSLIEFTTGASLTNLTLNQLNANIHTVEVPGTHVSFRYKFPATAYSIIDEGSDIVLGNETSITSNLDKIFIEATLTSDSDYLTPVLDLDRVSVVTVLNTLGNVLPNNKNAAGNYISKTTSLANPAEDIKVILDAKIPTAAGVDVYVNSTPYVARYIKFVPSPINSHTSLLMKTLTIYHDDGAGNMTPAGIITPTRFGIVSGENRAWLRDISEPLDFGTYPGIAVEGQLLDSIIPTIITWTGTYSNGDHVLYNGDLWKATLPLGVSSTVSEPTPNAQYWEMIPTLSFLADAAVQNDATVIWRKMKVEKGPDKDANTELAFNEYTYVLEAFPDEEFSSFSIKIELSTSNSGQVPEVSKLRALAVT